MASKPDEQPAHRWRYVVLLVVLGLLTHYILPRAADMRRSIEVARRLDPVFLGGAVLAQICSYFSSGWLLKATVGLLGDRLSLRRATAIEMAASTSCLVAGGLLGWVAAVSRWTQKAGVSSPGALVAASFTSFLNAAALLLFAITATVLLFAVRALSNVLVTALAVTTVLLVVTVVAGGVVLQRKAFSRIVRALQRLPFVGARIDANRLEEHAEEMRMMLERIRRRPWPSVSAAVLNLAFDALTLALIFAASGRRVGVMTLLAGYGLPLLLGRVSLLPGGVAVTEISMSTLYVSLGIARAPVVVSIVVYRLISFWLPTLLGIPLIVRLEAKR